MLLAAVLVAVGLPLAAEAATIGVDPRFADRGLARLDVSGPSVDQANDVVGNALVGSANGNMAVANPFEAYAKRVPIQWSVPSAAFAADIASGRVIAGSAGDDFAVDQP